MLAAQTRAVSLPALPKSSLIWKEIAGGVESFLEAVTVQLSEQVNDFEPRISPYARYALQAQGKQIRPVLVAQSAQSIGEIESAHVTAAAIVEMVHLATLVHDDVIDEARMRRARPTLAADCGNEIAVLLGDCLFAQSLKLAASFPTTEVCRAVASATKVVCSGEILQNQQRHDFQISREEYFKVLAMKTGELFALSCELGGFLSGATVAQRDALRQYGLSLGTAYQIYDDCVDLFSTEALSGKSLGTDLAKGKLTLPVLVAWERSAPLEREEIQKNIASWNPEFLPRILAWLEKHEALPESSAVFRRFIADAQEQLLLVPANAGRAGLLNLTEFLAQQFGTLDVVS
jgi:octaprenyl-diphosphate synthase